MYKKQLKVKRIGVRTRSSNNPGGADVKNFVSIISADDEGVKIRKRQQWIRKWDKIPIGRSRKQFYNNRWLLLKMDCYTARGGGYSSLIRQSIHLLRTQNYCHRVFAAISVDVWVVRPKRWCRRCSYVHNRHWAIEEDVYACNPYGGPPRFSASQLILKRRRVWF